MKLRFLILPLIALAAIVFITACGSDDDDDTPSQDDLYGTQTAQSGFGVETPDANETPGGDSGDETPVQAFGDACEESDEKSWSSPPPRIIDTSKTYTATIKTDKGEMVVEIDNTHAITANNFVWLACKGYYDGLTFHRVEPGFVIQGGDPLGDGTGGPGYTIPGEFEGSNFVTGVIGMARSGDPNSAGSQFYIMLGDAPSLDGSYADFGHITEGQDVAEQIAIGDEIEEISIEES